MCRGKNVNDGKINQQLTSLIEEEKNLDELIQSCAQQIRKFCEERHTLRYPLFLQSASLILF